MSGEGLPLETSAEVSTWSMLLKTCSERGIKEALGAVEGGRRRRTSGWAARFAATDAGDDEVAIAMGIPCFLKNVIASLTPGISATPVIRADKFSSHCRTRSNGSILPSRPRAFITYDDHSLLRMPMIARLMSGVIAAPYWASARLIAWVDSVSVSRRVPSRSNIAARMRKGGGNATGTFDSMPQKL